MIIWLFKHIILSLVLIFSIHYIYVFLKDNLTTPKTIDLIEKPKQKYNKIYASLKEDSSIKKDMKDELKNYLKQITSDNEDISSEPKEYSTSLYSNY